ncbi:MAG: universal stress protein [Elusimicrobia bacterium]|nr:universal stress protein [Elusimicrobiota bacterium]
MKVLIAYDGSKSAKAVLTDVARAGLPPEGEAVVFSVADIWPPSESAPDPRLVRAVPSLARAHARAKKILAAAGESARRGAAAVQASLPGWRVRAESAADSPAWAIFKKARDLKADLVVVGSQGRSVLARWTLGSVSQKVLMECPASVRVSRPPQRTGGPLRILLAVDGSQDAETAVDRVLKRTWPAGTLVRVMAVADDRLSGSVLKVPALARWARPTDTDPRAWLGRLVESVENRLSQKGLAASGRVRPGDPKKVLLDKAVRWRADMVFLGARGLTRWERTFLGSVSTSLAVHAPCSVEVVRRFPGV